MVEMLGAQRAASSLVFAIVVAASGPESTNAGAPLEFRVATTMVNMADTAATAIPAGFPTAETTGVPSGTNLTAYTGPMTISTNGTVIEGKIISGTLRVTADNVIIKNCLVTYDGWWGVDAEGAANITIQDCTFVGPGAKAPTQAAILGSGTFLRNDISKVENGITLTEGPSIVIGNYIHDLEAGGADPHYDGIELHGRQNGVLIENNTVIGRDTSDIFIKNNYGPISNVIVNNNFLAGNPGYNIYVDARASGGPITGVSITNNYMLKGNYGYISIDKATPTVSGNMALPPEHPLRNLLEIPTDQ